MRIITLAIVLAACQRSHEVALQLGPSDRTITAGFLCREEGLTTLLADRALTGTTYSFNVVIDVIDLAKQFPGCRGEELVTACTEKQCTIVPRADGTRYCQPVTFDRSEILASDLRPLLARIRGQLAMDAVTLDAPDQPVLIRAVATTEPCDTVPSIFDPTQLVGCAYSCPVQLDAVDGPIALSLDVLDTDCEREVRACAAFR